MREFIPIEKVDPIYFEEQLLPHARAPRRKGQVVDIFAALKKSLETAERPPRKAAAYQAKRKKA